MEVRGSTAAQDLCPRFDPRRVGRSAIVNVDAWRKSRASNDVCHIAARRMWRPRAANNVGFRTADVVAPSHRDFNRRREGGRQLNLDSRDNRTKVVSSSHGPTCTKPRRLSSQSRDGDRAQGATGATGTARRIVASACPVKGRTNGRQHPANRDRSDVDQIVEENKHHQRQ